jgi:hypothetical protein
MYKAQFSSHHSNTPAYKWTGTFKQINRLNESFSSKDLHENLPRSVSSRRVKK